MKRRTREFKEGRVEGSEKFLEKNADSDELANVVGAETQREPQVSNSRVGGVKEASAGTSGPGVVANQVAGLGGL